MTRSPLFATIDVGTTGARAVAFDQRGRRVAEVRKPYATTTPAPGWAEQDANAWGDSAVEALVEMGAKVDGRRVEAIGLTGQSPTVVPVDAGCRPLRPGMLYRDNRATREAAEMIDLLGAEKLHAITGHTPAAFHVGPKILWLRRHEPALFAATRWFLQPRDVVLQRLVGRVLTDASHADATALADLGEANWSADVLGALDLDPGQFPEVMASWSIAGLIGDDISAAAGLPRSTPVVIGAGDSQCAAFGAGVVAPGVASEMAGSSSCINSAVITPVHDLRITHYSHVVPGLFTTEVGLNTTGAAIRWAVRTLGFGSYRSLEAQAARVYDSLLGLDAESMRTSAPTFVPHLGDGERDDPTARARLDHLSDRHDSGAVAFAVLEGVASAVIAEVDALRAAGCAVEELRASGGGARIALLGRLKADLLGGVVRHLDIDASALGAAMLAASSVGYVDEAMRAIERAVDAATRFEPEERGRRVAQARSEMREMWR